MGVEKGNAAGAVLLAWCVTVLVQRLCELEHMSWRELGVLAAWGSVGGVLARLEMGGAVHAELAAAVAAVAGILHVRKTNIEGPPAIAADQMIDLKGKVVVVTGASIGGIGCDTALAFARKGAKVVLCLRNEEKAKKACELIKRESHNTDISYELLDLASLDSVVNCAQQLGKALPRVDILVNNAGLMLPNYVASKDGIESTIQVNCLSTHLFALLLVPKLRASVLPCARIINVSSSVHKAYHNFGELNLDRMIDDESGFGLFSSYSRSKFCLLALSHELNRQLATGALEEDKNELLERLVSSGLYEKASGETPIVVNSVMPGCIATSISQNMPKWAQIGHHTIVALLLKNCEQGARSTVYVATAKHLEAVGGKYFEHCTVVPGHSHANDPSIRAKVWTWANKVLASRLASS